MAATAIHATLPSLRYVVDNSICVVEKRSSGSGGLVHRAIWYRDDNDNIKCYRLYDIFNVTKFDVAREEVSVGIKDRDFYNVMTHKDNPKKIRSSPAKCLSTYLQSYLGKPYAEVLDKVTADITALRDSETRKVMDALGNEPKEPNCDVPPEDKKRKRSKTEKMDPVEKSENARAAAKKSLDSMTPDERFELYRAKHETEEKNRAATEEKLARMVKLDTELYDIGRTRVLAFNGIFDYEYSNGRWFQISFTTKEMNRSTRVGLAKAIWKDLVRLSISYLKLSSDPRLEKIRDSLDTYVADRMDVRNDLIIIRFTKPK